MKPEEAKEIMEQLGLKMYHVAIACQLHPTLFSKYLHHDRELSQKQLQKVTNYLTKLKGALH